MLHLPGLKELGSLLIGVAQGLTLIEVEQLGKPDTSVLVPFSFSLVFTGLATALVDLIGIKELDVVVLGTKPFPVFEELSLLLVQLGLPRLTVEDPLFLGLASLFSKVDFRLSEANFDVFGLILFFAEVDGLGLINTDFTKPTSSVSEFCPL